jgi:hypothetical protein
MVMFKPGDKVRVKSNGFCLAAGRTGCIVRKMHSYHGHWVVRLADDSSEWPLSSDELVFTGCLKVAPKNRSRVDAGPRTL